MYYGSYKSPRELLWMLGVVILLLMMATAFMGYVLPWGQMSYWGATVITNLFSAFPFVGQQIVTWLWGGFSVDNPTLNRFFSLHYLLPFVLVGVIFLHVAALHIIGSNNPLGIDVKSPQDTVPFHPYYTSKDSVGICVFLIVYAAFVFFAPNVLGDPNNFIPANPLQTPADIVPEWYFLPYYAILRSVPNKLCGVCMMFGSHAGAVRAAVAGHLAGAQRAVPADLPAADLGLGAAVILLGVCGAHKPEGIWVVLSRVCTLYYFLHFLVILPVLGKLERPLPLPESISRPVIGGGRGAVAGRRHGQADGEGVMRALRSILGRLARRGCLRRRCRRSGAGGADAAAAAMELPAAVRHLRPRCRAARLPGLFRGLLQLPFDEGTALSRPVGHRLDAGPDQGDRRRR